MKNAKVTRPSFETGDKEVILTATVTSGSVSKVKEFNLIVKKDGITDSQAVIMDLNSIVLPKETKKDLMLPTTGKLGSEITWESSNKGVITNLGIITRPGTDEIEALVTLTASITKGSVTETKEFKVKVIQWTIEEEINDTAEKLTWDYIKGQNASKTAISSNLHLPKVAEHGVKVVWTTSNDKYCTIEGVITKPSYTVGPIVLSLTAELEHKGLRKTVEFPGLVISTLEMTDQEVLERTKQVLQSSLFLGGNESLVAIKEDMILPMKISDPACSRASISWSLVKSPEHTDLSTHKNIEVKNNASFYQAKITRPEKGTGNIEVGLKAKITIVTQTKPLTDDKFFDIVILTEE